MAEALTLLWGQLEINQGLGHEEAAAAAGVYVSHFLGPFAQAGQAILSNMLSQAVPPQFWEGSIWCG